MVWKSKKQWWANYREYLKSVEWRELREDVFARDNYLCQNCFSRATQVPTKITRHNKTGHTPASDCIAICDDCHESLHPHMQKGIQSMIKDWLAGIIKRHVLTFIHR
jgi:5-methylcytosine-specific restriction endonuclease McrA